MSNAQQGGCQCGQLRYQFDAPLRDIAHCHCSICRRTSGGIVTTWITVPLASFQWLRGTPAEYTSSPTCTRFFCPGCGAQSALMLHPRPDATPAWTVTAGDPRTGVGLSLSPSIRFIPPPIQAHGDFRHATTGSCPLLSPHRSTPLPLPVSAGATSAQIAPFLAVPFLRLRSRRTVAPRGIERRRHFSANYVGFHAPPPIWSSERLPDFRLVPPSVSGVLECATCSSAALSIGGNSFPRLAARRSMPLHALFDKKYFCGISPVSRTRDNEHTLAALGQAVKLAIANSPGNPSRGSINHTRVGPSLPSCWNECGTRARKRPKKAPECVIVCAENSWDVFPHNESRSNNVCCTYKLQG